MNKPMLIQRRKLELHLQSPWLSRSSLAAAFGIDAPLARNAAGEFIIPGPLLIGRLAEAFRHLDAAGARGFGDDLKQVFFHDSGNDDSTANDGRRSIFASDLIMQDTSSREKGQCVEANTPLPRSRIAIDPVAQSVSEGALQVIEQVANPRAPLTFIGELRLLGPKNIAEQTFDRIQKALNWITQLGAARTIGFGVKPSVTHLRTAKALNNPQFGRLTDVNCLRLRLKLHDPVCVGDKRSSANTYMSAPVIPGAAVKGALAYQILKSFGHGGSLVDTSPPGFEELAKHFSQLRITHGFPVQADDQIDQRPRRIPISWAVCDGILADHALLDQPDVPHLVRGKASRFVPDWKSEDWQEAKRQAHWSEPDTELRIRTQIDKKLRAAQEERLFAIGYRRPDTHDWSFDVSLDEEEAVRIQVFEQLLSALAGGLAALGRGGAFASLVSVTSVAEACSPENERVIMVLQTPTLLRRPGEDAKSAYAKAFRELEVTAELTAIFMTEELRGAKFLAKRLPDGTDYWPWLLTEPGSTFVFDRVTDADRSKLSSWARNGLSIPSDTLAFYGLTETVDLWKHCPWLPENGYGEVAFGPTGEVKAPEHAQALTGTGR